MNTTPPRHSVSVSGVIPDDHGRVLLIRRRDNQHWEPPGGVLELDETIHDGLRREIREETGLDIEPDALTGVYKNMPRGIIALVFRCKITGGHLTANDEVTAFHWADQSDVRQFTSEAYAVRLLDALREGTTPAIRQHDGTDLLSLGTAYAALCRAALPNLAVFESRRRLAAPLARRQRRAQPWEARPAHAGPRSVRVAAIDNAFRNSRGAGRCCPRQRLARFATPTHSRAMTLRIRPATRADADAIAALHLASYRAAYEGLLPAEVLSSLRAEDRRRRWHVSLNDPQRRTLIAHDADGAPTVIGFAEVGPSRDDDAEAGTGELMALHVMPSRWRQGAGRALHDTAVATLATRGFQAVTLWVLTGNSRARAFYEAMGWNDDGTAREHFAWGIQVPEVRYRTVRPGH